MSTPSPREAAATDLATTQSQLSSTFARIGLPEIQSMFTRIGGQTAGGFGSEIPMIDDAFSQIRTGMNQDFTAAGIASGASIRQRAKQSGMPFSSEQLSDATMEAGNRLNLQKDQAIAQLNFSQASANLGEFNQMMQMLGAGTGTALQMGGTAGSQANQAASMMSDSSQMGSVLGGAAQGASFGSMISPGWGTLIGAVVGGAGGYFGSRG